jgi:diapolycopene oxygenase
VVIEKLKTCGAAAMPDLEDHIVVERALTPNGIERMYNAEGGAIYGLASHGRLAGGFKPRNRSAVLKNLYIAGGSANPGPGVPMVLMSGVTAARSLAEDLGAAIAPAADLVAARVEGRDAPVQEPLVPQGVA